VTIRLNIDLHKSIWKTICKPVFELVTEGEHGFKILKIRKEEYNHNVRE
jgi:hypothetical protein